MSVSQRSILDALGEIYDPCSISAGAPLSLTEMGLIEDVSISVGGDVAIRLRLTSSGCLMGPLVFDPEIIDRVSKLPGVRSVTIAYGDPLSWSESTITEDGRRKLAAARALKSRLRNTT